MGSLSQARLERDRPTASSTLEVKDLEVTFNKRKGLRGLTKIKAVDGITFALGKSEIVSIVGESGSGKTTVAKCIMGLVKPTKGTITYNGVNVNSLRGRALLEYRRNVQMIFQDPFESLNPRHDVFTILSSPLRQLKGMKDQAAISEEVNRLLTEVGLNPAQIKSRFPHQLSGGQRQRVNIARALAPDPRLLVADEPITMLDAAQKLNVLSLLVDLKEERDLTVLMITHDLASARLVSANTMVMYLGKIVEFGETGTLLSKPFHPYVELIRTAAPHLRRTESMGPPIPLAFIEESMSIERGCSFRPRCSYAKEVCGQVEPELEEKAPSHYAACHNALNSG